jgi:hypothetical protein
VGKQCEVRGGSDRRNCDSRAAYAPVHPCSQSSEVGECNTFSRCQERGNMTNAIQATDLPAPETLVVSLNSNSGVTMACEECGKPFAPETPRQRFCGNACRQSAHRKSPAHSIYLAQQKQRRLARRNRRCAEMNRDKSLSTLSVYSGPSVNVLPLRLMSLYIRRCKVCDVILERPRVRFCDACKESKRRAEVGGQSVQ